MQNVKKTKLSNQGDVHVHDTNRQKITQLKTSKYIYNQQRL